MTVLVRTTLRHPDGRYLLLYGDVHGSLPATDISAEPPALQQRRDPLSDEWIAISPARNTRPQTGHDVGCPLCPGGPEVPFDYQAAVFENRFPSFMPSPPPVTAPKAPLEAAPSVGRCEVVLYTSVHEGSLATLSPEEVCRVIAMWQDRSDDLWADPRHEFVLAFENRGDAVGATLSHPHGQIYAFDRLPPFIERRVAALRRHRGTTGRCASCELVDAEVATGERVVADNDSFLISVPYAARWPYEIHVRTRRHGLRRLGELADAEQLDLARALTEVVARYDRLFDQPMPYMMVALEAPAGAKDWHLAFEFMPPVRSATKFKVRASVETTTGVFINDTLPEASAAALTALDVDLPAWSPSCLQRVQRAAES